jgi:hypothetical protein
MTGNGCAGHGKHQNGFSAVIAARGTEWTVKQLLENRVNSYARPESAAEPVRIVNGRSTGSPQALSKPTGLINLGGDRRGKESDPPRAASLNSCALAARLGPTHISLADPADGPAGER